MKGQIKDFRVNMEEILHNSGGNERKSQIFSLYFEQIQDFSEWQQKNLYFFAKSTVKC